MTEYQAWRYLAKCWNKAKPYYYEQVNANVMGREGDGLCLSINTLFVRNEISWEVSEKMLLRITKLRRKRKLLYKWPTTLNGAKRRTEFCLRQAQLLKGIRQ